jgi:hypothetical protein
MLKFRIFSQMMESLRELFMDQESVWFAYRESVLYNISVKIYEAAAGTKTPKC